MAAPGTLVPAAGQDRVRLAGLAVGLQDQRPYPLRPVTAVPRAGAGQLGLGGIGGLPGTVQVVTVQQDQ